MGVKVTAVLGLGFGDEGKGTLVDWLTRRCSAPPMIVRWNGGPQAAHHVVTDDGRLHCFAQLGSGSFVDGVRTHHGPGMIVDPYALHVEAAALARVGVPDVLSRLTIDPRALLVTPWHAIVNQVRELLRGEKKHGSTGRGVVEAKLGATRLTASNLLDRGLSDAVERLRAELAKTAHGLVEAHPSPPVAARELASRAEDRDLVDAFIEACRELGPSGVTMTSTPVWSDEVILEGAQGALLDHEHGFVPHVTPSSITRKAAAAAARDLGLSGTLKTWGVLRAFHTRHGAGPFPSENASLQAALPEPHNPSGVAGTFRVGWFDGVLARWALEVAGPIDRLAVTCLDRIEPLAQRAVVDAWRVNGERVTDLGGIPMSERTGSALVAVPELRWVRSGESYVGAIEGIVGRRVDVTSWGMVASDKREGAAHPRVTSAACEWPRAYPPPSRPCSVGRQRKPSRALSPGFERMGSGAAAEVDSTPPARTHGYVSWDCPMQPARASLVRADARLLP